MIAPAAVKFNTDHFMLGSGYHKAMALKSYPHMTDERARLRGLGMVPRMRVWLSAVMSGASGCRTVCGIEGPPVGAGCRDGPAGRGAMAPRGGLRPPAPAAPERPPGRKTLRKNQALFFLEYSHVIHFHLNREGAFVNILHAAPITAPSQVEDNIEWFIERP